MSWTGKVFTPRGVSGLGKQIQAELRGVNKEWQLVDHELRNIGHDLSELAKLRIPQSVWVPLAEGSVTSVAEFGSTIKRIEWETIPQLQSHGPRVSLSKDSVLSRSVSQEDLVHVFREASENVRNTEISVRIDSLNRLSIQMNGIPPRVWVPTPTELDTAIESGESQPSWSVRDQPAHHIQKPLSEDSIKLFRNESSLCCMGASLLRSAGLASKVTQQEPLVIWDPFMTDSATILMESLNHILGSSGTESVTFVGCVPAEPALAEVKRRVMKFVDAHNLFLESTEANSNPSDFPPNIFSTTLRLPREVHIHITTRPFHEVLPHMRGALILSHIPKSYNEQLGLGKRQLTEWAAFGDLVRRGKDRFDIHLLCESGAFIKYTKLKFARVLHMVSPGGHVVASVNKWLGY